MTSRIKQMFSRRRDGSVGEGSYPQDHGDLSTYNTSGVQISSYDSTLGGNHPQTGEVPMKGNDTSMFSKYRSRRSSMRSQRSSKNLVNPPDAPSDHYDNFAMPANNMNNAFLPKDQTSRQYSSQESRSSADGQRFFDDTSHHGLQHGFSNMNFITTTGPSVVTQTVTTTRFPTRTSDASQMPRTRQVQDNHTATPQSGHNVPDNRFSDRRHHSSYDEAHNSSSQANFRDVPRNQNTTPEASAVRRAPRDIPSKSPVDGTVPPISDPMMRGIPPIRRTDQRQNGQTDMPIRKKPLGERPRSARMSEDFGSSTHAKPATIRSSSPQNEVALSGEQILKRAQTNSEDTQIIRHIAPAVVHETVNKNIHHIREELITREIHNHDIYHRILPVVDVEVLPPRHFLPVEGGGLVEVGSFDVPGRGKNWVIAETASKIPSDQAHASRPREFTARTFLGRDGDAKSYTSPDGHKVTENTWVHPPDLETGARDTGQSWPMDFPSKKRTSYAGGLTGTVS